MVADIYTLTNPVFRVFLCHAAVVLLKTSVMSVLTGMCRIKNKAYANAEDVTIRFAKAKTLTSHPQVERIRRAHLNDLENVLPFVLLGMLYLATNPSQFIATCLFRVFTLARITHTFVYLLHIRQPFRGLSFFAGLLVNVSMAIQVVLQMASF